jgi:hypothetical protein
MGSNPVGRAIEINHLAILYRLSERFGVHMASKVATHIVPPVVLVATEFESRMARQSSAIPEQSR